MDEKEVRNEWSQYGPRTVTLTMKPNTEFLSVLLPLNLAFPNSMRNPSKKHKISGK
jgi:hypothetical protein